MKGEVLPAAGQTVELMAPVTDAAFVPAGHDQIIASSSDGLSASATPPVAQRGGGIAVISGPCFSSSAIKQHFITTGMVMKG